MTKYVWLGRGILSNDELTHLVTGLLVLHLRRVVLDLTCPQDESSLKVRFSV